jgi:hypothetical protein
MHNNNASLGTAPPRAALDFQNVVFPVQLAELNVVVAPEFFRH